MNEKMSFMVMGVVLIFFSFLFLFLFIKNKNKKFIEIILWSMIPGIIFILFGLYGIKI